MAPSRHDWKIVDWDVKPQHNQPTNLSLFYVCVVFVMEKKKKKKKRLIWIILFVNFGWFFSSPEQCSRRAIVLPPASTVLRKVFKTSLFQNPLMDFVYIWYDDRYLSKILFSTIPTPMHDLKVKVTDLELFMLTFYVKVFRTSSFPNPLMDLVHVWCDDRSGPKFNTVPSPPPYMALRSRSRTWNFYVKVLR